MTAPGQGPNPPGGAGGAGFTGTGALIGGWQFCRDNRRDLLHIAAVPVVVLAILGALHQYWITGSPNPLFAGKPAQDDPGMETAASMAFLLISIMFHVMFAVAWHRRYLLPAERVTVATALKWDRRKFRYLLIFLALSILCTLPIVIWIIIADPAGVNGPPPIGAGSMSLFLICLIASIFIYLRLVLVLPAAALGVRSGLADAWRLSRGYALRLLLITVVPVLATLLLTLLMASGMLPLSQAIAEHGGQLTGNFLFALASHSVSYAGVAFGVSALSIAFAGLRGGAHDRGREN